MNETRRPANARKVLKEAVDVVELRKDLAVSGTLRRSIGGRCGELWQLSHPPLASTSSSAALEDPNTPRYLFRILWKDTQNLESDCKDQLPSVAIAKG